MEAVEKMEKLKTERDDYKEQVVIALEEAIQGEFSAGMRSIVTTIEIVFLKQNDFKTPNWRKKTKICAKILKQCMLCGSCNQ